MQKVVDSEKLTKFVEDIAQHCDCDADQLTINDLRLQIRQQRMSELSDWSDPDLEVIERWAAPLDPRASVASCLVFPADGELPAEEVSTTEEQAASENSLSWIEAPSPFAWT